MQQSFQPTPTAKDLEQMNQKISILKRKANESKIEARESFNAQLKAVEDQFNLVKTRMSRASHQAGAITDDVSDGVLKAWQELKSSFDRASQYLH